MRTIDKGSTFKRLKRFSPSRSQLVSGAMLFTAGVMTLASVPNVFTSGTTISASAVNDNFNGLDTRLASLEAADLDTRLAALEAKLASVSVETINGQSTVRFSGVNVQVVNGLGSTATANGTGNLVVGYDEADASGVGRCTLGADSTNDAPTDSTTCATAGGSWTTAGFKEGSHYIVTGSENNYSRWGGILAGYRNTSNYDYANVTGGQYNTAAYKYASVSGGYLNTASGASSSVSGGSSSYARGQYASISGGSGNAAEGSASSVSGGYSNTASNHYASVSGGHTNTASGLYATVSAGRLNTAIGQYASVSSGYNNTAGGQDTNLTGGSGCTNSTNYKWVVGSTAGGCSATSN